MFAPQASTVALTELGQALVFGSSGTLVQRPAGGEPDVLPPHPSRRLAPAPVMMLANVVAAEVHATETHWATSHHAVAESEGSC